MSSDLIQLTGTPLPFHFEGAEYPVHRLTPRDLAELDAALRGAFPSPLVAVRAAVEGLPEAVQVRLGELAWEDAKSWPPTFDTDEGSRYFTLGDGRGKFLQVALRKGTPGLTADRARELADRMDFGDVARLAMLTSGRDPGDPKATPTAPGAAAG